MIEGGPKFHSPTEELFAFWNKHPVVLASQSDYRKSQLESLGFSEVVKSIPIPETIEANYAEELNNVQGIASYYADDGRDVVRHIAGAKVHYILEHQNVDPLAIVLAFDTAPLLWRYDASEEKMVFEHLEKPTTHEDGHKLIAHVIAVTAEGCRLREKRLAEMHEQFAALPVELRAETVANLSAVLDMGTIEIVSAAAGSFPNNRTHVPGFSDEVSVFSQAIYDMRNDAYALEILSDKVITIMGDRVCKVSGGIDYTDSNIQDLLQISELKINILKDTLTGQDHYQGLSRTAFVQLLAHARAE